MNYLTRSWCSAGGVWAEGECHRPQRCGRSVEVTVSVGGERKIPSLLHTSSRSDISILIPPLSLSPSHSVTSSLRCPVLRYFLRSAPLLSFPASYSYLYKDRWGAEEMKEPSSNTHMQQSPGPNLKIYNKQAPLLLEKPSLCLRLCVCVPLRPLGSAVRPDSLLDDSSVVSFRQCTAEW